MHLQQLKGMQNSKQGMWKGYHLSIEAGIRKGYLFREKWVRSLPVWKHVSPFHFLGKQNSSKCRSFWRVNIVGIRFAERKCYNTSCYRYIRLLGSLTLPSETAVEAIFAPSNKFYRKKSLGAPGMKVPNDSSVGHAASRHVVYVISGAKVFLNHYS